MVHILIRHKVSDFNRWKEAFDSHLDMRKRGGETGFRVFHNAGDQREVVLLCDWRSIEEARAFMSAAELHDAMQQAGVIGNPEVQFLEDARSVHRSSAD